MTFLQGPKDPVLPNLMYVFTADSLGTSQDLFPSNCINTICFSFVQSLIFFLFIVFNVVNNTGHMVEPFSEKGLRGRYYLIRPNVCMYNAIYRNCNCGLPNSSIVRHD